MQAARRKQEAGWKDAEWIEGRKLERELTAAKSAGTTLHETVEEAVRSMEHTEACKREEEISGTWGMCTCHVETLSKAVDAYREAIPVDPDAPPP